MKLIECGRSYAPAILAILNEVITTSTAIYDYQPRTPAMMDAWFDAKEKGGYPVIGLADEGGRLLGIGTYGSFRAWPAYKYTVEHSVYVDHAQRGKGIGGKILTAVIERARKEQYHNLIGGIDAQNAASIALHKRFGFEFCGNIRHAGFKFDRWLDLHFYQLVLDTPKHPVSG